MLSYKSMAIVKEHLSRLVNVRLKSKDESLTVSTNFPKYMSHDVCCIWTVFVEWLVGWLVFEAHQQVLNQSLDVLGSLRGRRIVRCQLDECGQEILTLLHILLHFLSEDKKNKNKQKQLFNFYPNFSKAAALTNCSGSQCQRLQDQRCHSNQHLKKRFSFSISLGWMPMEASEWLVFALHFHN